MMIHSQLIVQRYQTGIQLIPPGRSTTQGISVAQLMSLPMNLYFMDKMSIMQKMNENTARSCGYQSAENGIGKSIRDISKPGSIQAILENDRRVIVERKAEISPEQFNRKDDCELTAISIKFPWFEGNHVQGILGCSILLDHENAPSLSESLKLLIQTGLLTPDNADAFHGMKIDGVFVDKRDKAILFLLIHGKTAKQIGLALQLSHRTIEHRLEAIKRKFSVSTKSELIERVVDHLR